MKAKILLSVIISTVLLLVPCAFSQQAGQDPHSLDAFQNALKHDGFTVGAGVKGFRGQAAYAAAKQGVIGLTRLAALDYAGENIRVNAVCPGIIETPMMGRFTGGTARGREAVIAQEPVGRMGKPEEIAATVLWMCSDLAGFVVGASIVVDGGQTV